MSFIKNRIKKLEKDLNIENDNDILIVILSTDDNESIKATITFKNGRRKQDTLHTDTELYEYFEGEECDTCIIAAYEGDEPVKGSLYEKVIEYGVTDSGRIDK